MTEILDLMLNEQHVKEKPDTIKLLGETYHSYQVVLKRPTKQAPLGFGYRCIQPDTGLVITVMCENSVVMSWNKVCDLSDTVCVGDRIICVNGETDAKVMVQELRKAQEVTMRLLKAGPRWHLDGATAECMRKIDWAVSKGLRFEERNVGGVLDIGMASVTSGRQRNADWAHYWLLFIGIWGPLLFMVFAFSDMFYGLAVYSALAATYWNWIGNAIAFAAAVYGTCLHVADWSMWDNMLQKYLSAAFLFYAFCFAFILKCRFYPFAPLVICLFHIVVFIMLLRASFLRSLRRSAFYKAAWRCCFLASVLTLGMWLLWIFSSQWDGENMYSVSTKERLAHDSKNIYSEAMISVNGVRRSLRFDWDCVEASRTMKDFRLVDGVPQAAEYTLSTDELNERDLRCAQIKTIWFLMWVSPLIGFGTTIAIGMFCFANSWDYRQDSSGVEKLIKGAVVCVMFILMSMWLSASIAAAGMSLTSTLMAFCAAAILALAIWCYLEIGKRAITSSIKESKLMQLLVMMATSNWVRAGLVVAFGALIPIIFFLSYLNQQVRKLRKRNTTNGSLTDGAEKVLESLVFWNWGNILIKANCLVMLYWLFMVGVVKWTYVFLSWLNAQLIAWDLGIVIMVFFAIGFTMFLLPPVPGVPVYVTSGVIIAARASATPLGFWWGIAIASMLSFVLKLVACSGQYMIGWCLGKSVKVQQTVGVDKLIMRAVEHILLARGFTVAKVSVLVGGPDWPTSVICGILHLNLCQILLGTMPVIFVSTPCVLAGAFLSGPGNLTAEQQSLYDTCASTLLAVSIFLQGGSMLLAGYFIQETISKHSNELMRFRPEHQPVVELTQKEAEATAAWNDVLHWDMLITRDRALILSACGCLFLSMFIFAFMDEACHRTFNVNNDINASFGQGGLEGNALNIVLLPGWGANGLFLLGAILHFIFVRIQTRKAAIHLEWKRANPRLSVKRSNRSTRMTTVQKEMRGSTGTPAATTPSVQATSEVDDASFAQ